MTRPVQRNYEAAQYRVAAGLWLVDPDEGVILGVRRMAFKRLNSWGYVQIKFRDASDWRKEQSVLAHRVIWEAIHGPLADDLTINHINGVKTDNRLVNLEAVSMAENQQHAVRSGLRPVGVDHGNAKLSAEAVRDIYRRAWAGERLRPIAARHGTDHGTVSRIKNGHAWLSVTGHAA